MSRNIMKLIMIVVVLAGAAAAFADPNIPILASIDFDDNDATGGGVLTAFGDIGVFQLRDHPGRGCVQSRYAHSSLLSWPPCQNR